MALGREEEHKDLPQVYNRTQELKHNSQNKGCIGVVLRNSLGHSGCVGATFLED